MGERPSLALTVTQTAAQRLRIEDLHAEIAAAQLSGRAELDFEGDRLSAEARLAVPDLAPVGTLVETPASGALSVDLVADGALTQPKGHLDLEISAPEVAGVAAERITTNPSSRCTKRRRRTSWRCRSRARGGPKACACPRRSPCRRRISPGASTSARHRTVR